MDLMIWRFITPQLFIFGCKSRSLIVIGNDTYSTFPLYKVGVVRKISFIGLRLSNKI